MGKRLGTWGWSNGKEVSMGNVLVQISCCGYEECVVVVTSCAFAVKAGFKTGPDNK